MKYGEAQAEVLSAILADLRYFDKPLAVRNLIDDIGLVVDAFPSKRAKDLYEAVLHVYLKQVGQGGEVRFSDVMSQLESAGSDQMGFWQEQFNTVEKRQYSFKTSAQVLMNNYLRGEIVQVLQDTIPRVTDAKNDVRGEVAGLVTLLTNLTLDGDRENRPKNILAQARLAGGMEPDSTGVSKLDYVWKGGWRRKWLTIWGAPSGHGKSSMACSFVAERVRQGKPSLVQSFEMPKEDILFRILCNLSSVTLEKVKDPNKISMREEAESLQMAEEMTDRLVRVYDENCDMPEVEVRIRRTRSEFGPAMNFCVVDHIGIVNGGRQGKDLGNWSRDLESSAYQLKSMAKRQSASMLVFSQVPEKTREELIATNRAMGVALRGSQGI